MNNKSKTFIIVGFLCVILGSASFSFLLSTTDENPAIITNAGANIVNDYGRLQVYGSQVCAEDGRQITLGGMSFFWSNWASEWYDSQTVDYLVDTMKVSVIRAAYGVPLTSEDPTEPLGPSDTVWAIEAVIDAAINRGIYVIIDFHGEGDLSVYENEAKSFFAGMAQKYGNTPNVIYELWNEPTDQSTSTIQTFCQNVANEIRIYDSDNLIICGSATWSQYPQSYTISDSNAAYTFHGYFDDASWGGAHMSQFYTNVQAAMNQGSAVFVTEFGANYGDTDGTDEIINACQDMGISMCAWSVHDKEEPWSIFNNGEGLGSLTAWGNYLQSEFEIWPGAENTDYGLSTIVSGEGTVSPSSGSYSDGDTVTLTATPSSGWIFDHWEGDLTGSTNPDTITMDSNKLITAVFVADVEGDNVALNKPATASSFETTEYEASNAVDGDSTTRWASEFSDPQWIYVDLQSSYDISRIILNWEAAYSSAYEIQISSDASSWTSVYSTTSSDGDLDDITISTVNARYVRMYGTARATAYGHSLYEFEVYGTQGTTQYGLTTSVSGSGTVSPSSGTYNAGDSVTLTATPAIGWYFSGWSGDLSGNTNPNTFTMNSDMDITATFIETTTQYSLTTSVSGSGLVSPSSGLYDAGDPVTLTATPLSGWSFSSWSGSLTGNTNPITFTMNSNMDITAIFTQTDVGGNVFIEDVSGVRLGDVFTSTVYVDTGSQLVASYGFDITFNPAILQVSDVVASVNGFMAAVNIDNTAGTITVAGFEVAGVGPSVMQDLLDITWEAISEGESVIGITINALTDENTDVLGVPNGIDNTYIVTLGFDLGDVNHDEVVNIIDALLVSQYYVGQPVDIDETLADVNEDGSINIVDALLIAQYYVELIPELPPQ